MIKIEGFQLTSKRAIKCTCTNVCRKWVPYSRCSNVDLQGEAYRGSRPPTACYRLDVLPGTQPTVSVH